MFWSSPSRDLEVAAFLTAVVVLISIIVYWRSKKLLLSITIFSILEYFIASGTVNHWFVSYYNVEPLLYFTKKVWPIINILLIVVLIAHYIYNRRKKI